MNTVSVVIAEHGADWLDWASQMRDRTSSTLILAQHASEDDGQFADRVAARLLRVRNDGGSVREAAFVSARRDDDDRDHERAPILRRLAAALANSGRKARLYLVPGGASRSAYRVMSALAWALSDLANGALSVSVASGPGEALLDAPGCS